MEKSEDSPSMVLYLYLYVDIFRLLSTYVLCDSVTFTLVIYSMFFTTEILNINIGCCLKYSILIIKYFTKIIILKTFFMIN